MSERGEADAAQKRAGGLGAGSDLAPLFTVGRFYLQDGRRLLPLAMQLHHAACDGYHAAMFLKDLQDWMDDFAG